MLQVQPTETLWSPFKMKFIITKIQNCKGILFFFKYEDNFKFNSNFNKMNENLPNFLICKSKFNFVEFYANYEY